MIQRDMTKARERAEKIARVFAGQWLEFQYNAGFGRVVGYREDTAEVAFEIYLSGAATLVKEVVITAPLTKGKLVDPSNSIMAPKAQFRYCDAERVSSDPPYPKIPRLTHLPHKCNRCGACALLMSRTVDCSNWECYNYYLKS